ncbi:adenine-specific DNA methylase [Conyzicola lurida]|uniref:Methyltransferase n=1 Tax=Conyzicola lurida TaxID=1172621 RepID=A0A841AKH5_9MICO|nr:DNA methyltransferase [Conyzicola lurida]MBB5843727.1 adenine-specific DNA methylase [Conyzicola lurida]
MNAEKNDVVDFDTLEFDGISPPDIHQIFRFPAKFHPPAVDALIERFTQPGQTILDPFCGSGTLLVEAAIAGRNSVGSDVDPLAVAISKAKISSYRTAELQKSFADAADQTRAWERTDERYKSLAFADISASEASAEQSELWVPEIPKLDHWFRRYVVSDLARIRAWIAQHQTDPEIQELLLVVFGSIIRNSSNADPVPVSGLEVTAHMLRKDAAGRVVNPFALFRKALKKTEKAVMSFSALRAATEVTADVKLRDAQQLGDLNDIDAIITSPPYQNAVDYYRRHQLEMFWLGHTESQKDRLELLPRYIGRARVASSHPSANEKWRGTPQVQAWLDQMRNHGESRARDFQVYFASMTRVFESMSTILKPGSPAIFIVGRSTWNGIEIPTDELFVELAGPHFQLSEHLTYPVRNRYMSYVRRNGADINTEHVLVFRRNATSGLENSS